MTPTQEKIYKYIITYYKKHGKVPSTVVAGTDLGVSHQSVHNHYKDLIKHGKLKKNEEISHFLLVDKSVAVFK